jgi:hypothetical protein
MDRLIGRAVVGEVGRGEAGPEDRAEYREGPAFNEGPLADHWDEKSVR